MGVEDRNFTGIQLIDRNDELCILYEKSNIQESIIRNGDIELRKKEEVYIPNSSLLFEGLFCLRHSLRKCAS